MLGLKPHEFWTMSPEEFWFFCEYHLRADVEKKHAHNRVLRQCKAIVDNAEQGSKP